MTEEQGIQILAHLDRIHWLLVALILCNSWILGGVIWRVICYAKASSSLWICVLAVSLFGVSAAQADEEGPNLVKRGAPSSFEGELNYSSEYVRMNVNVTSAGGIKVQGSGLDRSQVNGQITYGKFGPVITVNPDSHGDGGINTVGVQLTATNHRTEEANSSEQYGVYLYFQIKQAGGVWRSTVEFDVNTRTKPAYEGEASTGWELVTAASDGRSMPDWTQTYQVQLAFRLSLDIPHEPDNNIDATIGIVSHWVWVNGLGEDDDQSGGGGDGGDGGNNGGGGGSGDTRDDPGKGDEDPDAPKPTPPEPPADSEEPDNTCWSELSEVLKEKFGLDKPTIGSDLKHRFEIQVPFGDVIKGDGSKTSFYLSLTIDESWEPGVAFKKLLDWVRNFMILFILICLFHAIMTDLARW